MSVPITRRHELPGKLVNVIGCLPRRGGCPNSPSNNRNQLPHGVRFGI